MTAEEQAGVMDSAAESQENYSQEAYETSHDEGQVADHNEAQNSPEMNFKAFREEIDQIKNERNELRQQLELLRQNQYQQQSQQEESYLPDGVDEDDYVSAKQLKNILEQREQQYNERLMEMQFAQNHPDYNEVLEKYTRPLLQEKPHLLDGLRAASNKALYAYDLGKMAMERQNMATNSHQTNNAARIVQNANKPATLSGAGGSAPLRAAKDYSKMTREEFLKEVDRNRRAMQ